MGTRDPRVDAYIAKSAEFARPILLHLREVVHAACPDVEETMKWSMPHFTHEGMLCGMAAFKQHCTFGFWKARLIPGLKGRNGEAMGQFGRITRVSDLPPKASLAALVKAAARLNEAGVRPPARQRPARKPEAAVPEDLAAALARNRKARMAFEGFSPSHRREYVQWITEAKRDDTRRRRVRTAVEWLAEGKPRNWKYMRA